jgi:cyanophycin synthetase
MREELDCNIALFSIQPDNFRVKEHCDKGGLAAMIDSGYITICQGQWKTHIEKVSAIPITHDGRSESMVKNLLPMALVGTIRGLRPELIRSAMNSFNPVPEQAPGRMNLFKFSNFEVLLDYAHNVDGFTELKKFLMRTEASKKIGVLGVTGDRRNEDLIEMGMISAEMFNKVIFKFDRDLRGRTKGEMEELFRKGVEVINKDLEIVVAPTEPEAIDMALREAGSGTFVVVCADDIMSCIRQLRAAQDDDRKKDNRTGNPGH